MSRRHRLWAAGGGIAVAAAVVVVILLTSGSHDRSGTSGSTTTTTATLAPAPPGPLPPATPAAAQPAPPGQTFGASVNLLFNSPGLTTGQIDAQLQSLHGGGATIARSDALWEASEPAAPVQGIHRYVWTFDDRIAGALAAHHLRWLPILDYTAPWAQSVAGQDHSPPRSATDYAAYAGAFAARYGTGGSFWREHPALPAEPVDTYEIWNEPDSPVFWVPAPDAARYADLYLAARQAILAAQPTARVIVGGLTRPTSFLPAMVAARPQLVGHVDGVAVHPYESNPFALLADIRSARATLKAGGMGAVPLYVTEFGWSTSPPGNQHYASATIRPGYISGTLKALGHLNCGVAAGVVYTWFSPQQNPADLEQWFGIDSPTGARTPSTRAFRLGLQDATAPAPAIRLCR
jgi:hypothetical protein